MNSSYPNQPDQSQANGPYLIEARSREASSHAAVKLGAMATGSEHATAFAAADAEFDPDGTLTAKGAAGVDLLNVGGVLDIANFSSSIEVDATGDEDPHYDVKTNLGSIRVLGMPIGITEKGVTALGLGLPIDAAARLAETALKTAGVRLRLIPATTHYVEGTKQVDSIESASLEIGVVQNIPTQGPVEVKLTLGRVVMHALDQRNDDASAVGGGSAADGSVPGDVGDLGATTPGAEVGSGGLGDLGPAPLGDLPAPQSSPAGPEVAAPRSGGATGQGAPVDARRASFTSVDNASGVYLVLMLAGAASVVVSRIMRLRGIGG